jgi:hypothetical protein
MMGLYEVENTMTKLTGQCLCGNVKFTANGEVAVQANCHCVDCRQTTGATFATLLFMQHSDVQITGATKSFSHSVDSGNTLSKHFCPNCGSQVYGTSKNNPQMIALRAGCINEQEVVKPQINVFAGSKMDCTIMNPDLPAPERMPD